ncbi:MAG: adenylosuccinate lyase [Acidimicrobiaceae bacterium]|nr:MAG: adenylosuccinate lyase [marine actinobacterium MedAcidi-G2A]MAT02458.1 adenylosuccinate lyase [Acidimicrobiaceae bacterium]MBA4810096.1 adenylosuccinate lyase [Acidimicrobiales bacterium]MBC85208.1 adenylosuccinate lyase [Acidimicrobiaceae bacterium]|tara:strand:+ start:13544 stop:14956 length:1413 start_codon:yes stop_codon:yes gene_type:complete
MSIPNILAQRYASEDMTIIWSSENKVLLERELWIAVLQAQREVGQDIPEEAIAAYQRTKNDINLESILEREKIVKHDVKARIEEFCDLAGYQLIHKGMTSRDLTENIEQLQIRQSVELIQIQAVAALVHLAKLSEQYSETPITGRTHNVAAQVTTVGKRFANAAEEMLLAFLNLEDIIRTYPMRGVKGPVGTQQDLLELLGDDEKVTEFEASISEHLGFHSTLESVGQVYPRSLDFNIVSSLVQLSSGPANLAKTLRLMAGHDLATEGFQDGQVGSSAMPHKMNMRSCERIGGLSHVIKGYLSMVTDLTGDQWNEGDVSCSVVRRVALPDAFLAMDGLLQTFLTVLQDFGVYPRVIERELKHFFPFLSTTRILTAAVEKGMGREEAHEIIKEHAVAAALVLRNEELGENLLTKNLGSDERFPLTEEEIIFSISEVTTGLANKQIQNLSNKINELQNRYPESLNYVPAPII